jgi:hypothetical protein
MAPSVIVVGGGCKLELYPLSPAVAVT